MIRIVSITAAALALALSGCVAGATFTATTGPSDPDLVYVQPGVYVVAERTYPTYYADGYYWMHNGGIWYRSSYSNRGWVHVHHAPVVVRRTYTARSYRAYRRPARVERRDPHRAVDRRDAPSTRDHRDGDRGKRERRRY